MNAIETEHLTKGFRQLRGYRDLALYPWRQSTSVAVDDVSMAVRQGEVYGLLGENGAGKTTLIRMLTTTLIPTSGRAFVGGHDVIHEAHAVRKAIGLVSGDERTFYWRLTGRQNLEFFAALYHVPDRVSQARIADLLDTLGIGTYADNRFNTYSTGIRQKFAIARGLLTEPRLLFLDEPTRALDPIAADDVRRYIAEHIVGQRQATVLVATHTLSEAEALCDRVAIIRHGRVVAAGSVAELRSQMAVSSSCELVVKGSVDRIRTAICTIPGVEGVSLVPEHQRVHVTVGLGAGNETLNPVLAAILASGAVVESSTTRQPTLDDIYRAAHADV